MFGSAILEIVSIGAVIPFLGALTSPELVFGNPLMKPVIDLLGIQAPEQLALLLTVAFAVIAMGSGVFRLASAWRSTAARFISPTQSTLRATAAK